MTPINRRKFVASTTGLSIVGLAGCSGNSQQNLEYEIVAEPPAGLVYTDIKSSTDESDLLGEVFVITGTLENTDSVEMDVPEIIGTAYTADDVMLGDATNGAQRGDTIAPGEKVRFTIKISTEADDVGQYSLEFIGEEAPTVEPTPSESETESPPPEPVNESFYDDFDSGDIRTSTQWQLNLIDKQATEMVEADASIVSESGPDDGNGSLSFAVQNGGRATATSSEVYRWDAPFLVEGAFKLDVRMDRFAHTRIGLFGGEVLIDIDIPNTSAGIDSRNGRVDFVRTDIGEWKDGVWYLYDCEYDGDGRYSLTLWEESSDRSNQPTAVTRGQPLDDTELPIVITNYAGGDITANHAFIRYTAGDAL